MELFHVEQIATYCNPSRFKYRHQYDWVFGANVVCVLLFIQTLPKFSSDLYAGFIWGCWYTNISVLSIICRWYTLISSSSEGMGYIWTEYFINDCPSLLSTEAFPISNTVQECSILLPYYQSPVGKTFTVFVQLMWRILVYTARKPLSLYTGTQNMQEGYI